MRSIVNQSASVFSAIAMDSRFIQVRQAQQALNHSVRRLRACTENHVTEAYHEVLRTAEHLFWLEQILMEEYHFPAKQSHLEQHARVLHGLHCVHCAVMHGDTAQGRHAGGELLTQWMRLHQDTIDAAFQLWMDYCDCGLVDPRGTQASPPFTAH